MSNILTLDKNIANKYKAGFGLKYLDDFINSDILEKTVKTFLSENQMKLIDAEVFETYIKKNTNKDVNWFFEDYLKTRDKIDFKIKKVVKSDDSITITIKNKGVSSMPVSLYSLNNDSIL